MILINEATRGDSILIHPRETKSNNIQFRGRFAGGDFASGRKWQIENGDSNIFSHWLKQKAIFFFAEARNGNGGRDTIWPMQYRFRGRSRSARQEQTCDCLLISKPTVVCFRPWHWMVRVTAATFYVYLSMKSNLPRLFTEEDVRYDDISSTSQTNQPTDRFFPTKWEAVKIWRAFPILGKSQLSKKKRVITSALSELSLHFFAS